MAIPATIEPLGMAAFSDLAKAKGTGGPRLEMTAGFGAYVAVAQRLASSGGLRITELPGLPALNESGFPRSP